MRYGREAICFGYCLFQMRETDVVIAGTSGAEVLLNREDIENLMKARHDRPLLLIDLSVPRNIDPATADLSNVTFYDIDDLEALALEGVRNLGRRQLAACEDIIDRDVAALMEKLLSKTKGLIAPIDPGRLSIHLRYRKRILMSW